MSSLKKQQKKQNNNKTGKGIFLIKKYTQHKATKTNLETQ